MVITSVRTRSSSTAGGRAARVGQQSSSAAVTASLPRIASRSSVAGRGLARPGPQLGEEPAREAVPCGASGAERSSLPAWEGVQCERVSYTG